MLMKLINRCNGLMIDCARLIEKHDYYFRLIEYMADWEMNVLLLHFTDDEGCGVSLPGFEKIAMPHAFSAVEICALVSHAARRGIDIIPELELFAHTRYLTDRPEYAHLYAGTRTTARPWGEFGPLDPLSTQTHDLARRLIASTARLFPSKHMHLGCDEVEFPEYCEERHLSPEETWAAYVNKLIGYARSMGKTPMIWADHPAKNKRIAQLLRKDVVLVYWNYETNPPAGPLKALRQAGFSCIVDAPSLVCYHNRFLPTQRNLLNTRRMIRKGMRFGTRGTITTIWLPQRYVQGTMHLGIAYSAWLVKKRGTLNWNSFLDRFARTTFAVRVKAPLKRFLTAFPRLDIPLSVVRKLDKKRYSLDPEELMQIKTAHAVAEEVLTMADRIAVGYNEHILADMVLAAKTVWLCCEGFLIANGDANNSRKKHYLSRLRAIKQELSYNWDATRYADDSRKEQPTFPASHSEHMLLLVKNLPRLHR